MPPQILRITGGTLKGRKIKLASSARPPSQKLRESLFQQIADYCHSRALDLFAGSGTLGIEALSRGAESVQFIEQNRSAVRTLHHNLHSVGLDNKAAVRCRSVLPFLKHTPPPTPFPLIFCDPPFHWGKESVLLSILIHQGWLSKKGILILRSFKKSSFDSPLPPCRIRTIGESTLYFYTLLKRETIDRKGTKR